MIPVPWGTRNHWVEKFHSARDTGWDGGRVVSCPCLLSMPFSCCSFED